MFTDLIIVLYIPIYQSVQQILSDKAWRMTLSVLSTDTLTILCQVLSSSAIYFYYKIQFKLFLSDKNSRRCLRCEAFFIMCTHAHINDCLLIKCLATMQFILLIWNSLLCIHSGDV